MGAPDADRAPEPVAVPAQGPDSARPGTDWDGGWRRVAPPTVTVARSSIGVSDGLRFRSRLASWQNVAYSDGGLGHAVLPSAPVGLVHGVARTPGTPRTAPSGAPLVLRAAAPSAPSVPSVPEGGATGTGPGPTPPGPGTQAPPGPRRVVRAVSGSASRASGPVVPPVENPAPVRARRTAPPLIVARRPAKDTPRTVSAVPSSGVPAPVVQRRADVPGVPAGPGVRPALGGPSPERPSMGAPSAPPAAADSQPSGPDLPVVQRQADASGGAPDGPDLPVVQRQADASGGGSSARPTLGGQPSVTGSGGAVRRQTDTSAAAPEQPAPAVPDLPVVQRQLDAPAGPEGGSSVRPTLGGPAQRQADASAAVPERSTPGAPAGPALPVVQRQAGASAGSGEPGSGAPAGPALPVVQRQAEPSAAVPGGSELPLIQRQLDGPGGPAGGPSVRPTLGGPAQRQADASATPEYPAPDAPAGPDLPVVQRQLDAPAGPADSSSVRPALDAQPPVVAPGEPALPAVQRQVDAPAGPALPVVQRQADAPASTVDPSVRPPLGGQPSGPVRPVVQRQVDASTGPADRPTPDARPPVVVPGGPALPVVQRQSDAPTGPAARPAQPVVQRQADASAAPVRPAPARPTLGKPLRELPAGAAPFAPSAREAGPAHPAPRTPPSAPGSPARGGLGAPLSALPPTAGTARDAARPAQPGPAAPPAMPLRTAPTAPPPVVPRTPEGPVRVRPAPRPAPVQRSRALLAARTLAVSTGAADGFTAREAAASRPVVPATWRRDTPRAETAPGAPVAPVVQRVAADPVTAPRPHAPLPARSAAPQEPPVPAGLEPRPAPRGPVVRPHPSGGPAAPVQRLAMPVAAEHGAPAPGPVPEGGAPSAPQPRAVRPTPPQANAQAVQRAVAHHGLAGVPVTVVQRQPTRSPAPERPAEPAPDVDVEDLARRLIDPVARLLRADLRRGRERSGRPYDGRR
ncbi:hypothetical protein [Streptomyces sp. NBC_00209]|uniref:hypothetical protein n=1 Tax=Streptomyces sp. NBC_00209 TaxID=2975682 RepID=UPI00325018CA